MENINCILCGSEKNRDRFVKKSRDGKSFTLVKCSKCGLEYINPRPTVEEISIYYNNDYFTSRTDRGYDNYFSPEVRGEIERVMEMNLKDLGFYQYEKSIGGKGSSLDIGCAAGYFVNYMNNRGWKSKGIDVALSCVDFANENGLDVISGDYLKAKFDKKFDLITLWASIEHLHRPDYFIQKISDELVDNGRLYISTCRQGGSSFMRFFGAKWRFYNFPEHLYFFSYKQLERLLKQNGFEVERKAFYGSGVGKGGTLVRKVADWMAKNWGFGDMMILSAKKIEDGR